MKFFVLGDKDTVLGFELAGVTGKVVQDADEVREGLREAFEDNSLGIIIIPERLADLARQDVDQYTYKTSFPLIIEIPDRMGPIEGRGSVRDMIRSAVGIHL